MLRNRQTIMLGSIAGLVFAGLIGCHVFDREQPSPTNPWGGQLSNFFAIHAPADSAATADTVVYSEGDEVVCVDFAAPGAYLLTYATDNDGTLPQAAAQAYQRGPFYLAVNVSHFIGKARRRLRGCRNGRRDVSKPLSGAQSRICAPERFSRRADAKPKQCFDVDQSAIIASGRAQRSKSAAVT